ncbi:MAG: GNAT family N-acetyltransferase [Candidatus Saccharimonas sp.]
MELLERYKPEDGDYNENLRVQQLLDMARGIHDRSPRPPEEVVRELGHYAQYNGDSHGVFHIVRDPNSYVALTHTAWFEHSLQFNALAVSPDYRGHGIAHRLIYTLARVAIERDIDDVWVYAMRNSHASKVYARLGMTVPPQDDERHVLHGRYYPMSASPYAIVEASTSILPFEIVGHLPRGV